MLLALEGRVLVLRGGVSVVGRSLRGGCWCCWEELEGRC